MWLLIVLLILFAISAQGLQADPASVARGLILGLIVGLATAWGWVYSWGWNARVEAEKDETIAKAEERADQARR